MFSIFFSGTKGDTMIMYQERYEIGGQCLDLTNFTLSLIKESQANPELRDYLPRPKFETSTYFVENWVKLCNGEYRRMLLHNKAVIHCEDNVLFSSIYGNLRLYEFQVNALMVNWIRESSYTSCLNTLTELGGYTPQIYHSLIQSINTFNLGENSDNPTFVCLFYILENIDTSSIVKTFTF